MGEGGGRRGRKGRGGQEVASYPGLQIAGGRPGIHCSRMRLISPKILENRISRYSSVKQ